MLKGETNMSPIAWESFVMRIMAIGLNAAQSTIRIALIVAVAYVIVKLMRATFRHLKHL